MPSDSYGLSPQTSYTAISAALLLPLIIWPIQIMTGINDQGDIHTIWIISASVLLLSAATADSLLHYRAGSLSPLTSATWILASGMAISVALRSDQGILLLASLFGAHSLRSGIPLWRNQSSWWLWPAWGRDTTAGVCLFGWQLALYA